MKRPCRFSPLVHVIALLAATVLLTVATATSVLADPYDDGLKMWEKKEYEKSIAFLQKALKQDPKSAPAKQLLAWNYIKFGRMAEAETLFLEIRAAKKDDVRAFQGLGWIYGELGRNEEAIENFKQEAAWAKAHINSDIYVYYELDDKKYIESIYSDANYGLGTVYRRMWKYDDAVKHLETALKEQNAFTPEADIQAVLGDVYYEQGKWKQALRPFERAAKEDKKNPSLQIKIGWCRYFNKDYDDAEKAFEKALGLQAGAVEARYGLAMSQYYQNKFDAARKNFSAAIALNPYFVDNVYVHGIIDKKPEWKSLWKDFGLAYKGKPAYNYRLGNFPAALYKLAGYVDQVNPRDVEALTATGWCYRWVGSLDKAAETFNAAIKLDPKADEALAGLGSTYMAYGKLPEALNFFNAALKINPNNPITYNGMAYLHLYQKDEKKAEEALRKAVSLKKDYIDCQAFLGNLLYGQKRFAEAVGEYDKLVQIDKKLLTSWNSLGWAAYFAGQTDKAIAAFGESKKLNPFLVEAHYGLGMAYAKKGNLAAAKPELAAAIEIYPYYAHTADLVALIKANPSWSDLTLRLGWSYYYKQQYQPALAAFKGYLSAKADDISAKRGLAWSNYWVGQMDTAYTGFQELLKKDAGDVDAMIGSGWVLFAKNRDQEALAILKAALAKDPKRTDALRAIAAIAFRAKNFTEANALYKKIQELEPRALDIHNNQGWTLYREQKYAEAIAKFNESIRIYRYYGEPHYGLGMCCAKMGEIDKARESFTTAIYLYPAYMDGQDLYQVFDSNPKLRELYNAMGWSYFYTYSYNAAKFHFDRLLKADPGNRDALLGLGTVSYVLGEYKDAAGTLGKLVAGIPATADAWDKWSYMLDNLGWSHYFLKDYDKAREAFRRLETYHPKVRYIAPINGMAWTELRKGNKAEAEKIFAASLKIVPGNYSAEAGMRELKK